MENDFRGEGSGSQNSVTRPRYFKIVVGAFIALFLLVGGFAFYRAYKDWTAQEKIERLAEAIRNWEKENYERQLADTYGGKTPQETLKMYIEAVEKGDYELASKYFIEEKREDELRSFNGATKESIEKYLKPLKNDLVLGEGKYSSDRKYFSFDGPVLINLILYPNGIWKIVEI